MPPPRRRSSSNGDASTAVAKTSRAPTAINPRKPPNPTALNTKTPEELAAARKEYGRGERISTKAVKDKKLRGNLKKLELRYKDAAAQAKDAELLQPEQSGGYIEAEGELERTWKLRQNDIGAAVDVSTAQKRFELQLNGGGYQVDYTMDGRYLLLGGRKGHVAAMDWREGKLASELWLGETVRDVKWLHNEQFYAVAQKKYVYIYDHQGTEVHCLKKHIEVNHMEYLPYHFLLATIGNAGYLKYQDTSTGSLITEIPTKLGTPTSMTQNRRNAVLHVGHGNGSITLWSPNLHTPLVQIQAHKGPIRAIAIDRGGHYMATAGADARMNIFDIRTYKEVHSYFTPTPASSLQISDTGLLAVGWGSHITLWKDALRQKQKDPYMAHHQEGSAISGMKFCPYDDILGAGHDTGFSSLIIPGAGEANFDALEANPYATKKQKQEAEVKRLLEKLRPEMIALDPEFVGRVDRDAALQQSADIAEKEKDKALMEKLKSEEKNRMRGKNSSLRKALRKKGNIIDYRRLRLEKIKSDRKRRADAMKRGETEEEEGTGSKALERFKKPKQR